MHKNAKIYTFCWFILHKYLNLHHKLHIYTYNEEKER